MTVEDLSKINRIFILRLSSLGDILLSTPLIRAIKTQFPGIEIDMVVREEYADTIRLNSYINQKYFYSRNDELNNELLKSIATKNYELVIDLQNNFRSRKIASAANSKTVRLKKKSLEKFLLVSFKINKLKNEPQIPVRYAGTIQGLTLDNNGIDLFTDRTPSDILLHKEKIIGLCPGARHCTKRWPKEYFIELGKLLSEKGYNIVLFGGKSDLELCKEICDQIPGSINLSNNNDLLQIAADMKKCSAIVCNDSGLMHVASSTKAKVITIFGSSVKEFGFTPYNSENLILENNSLTCRPCSHIGKEYCPKKHFECMKEIKPSLVFNRVISFLNS